MIRAALRQDLDAVLAIERAAPKAAHWTRAQYEAALSQPERIFLVAAQAGSVAGFLVAFVATQEWELENIVVLSSLWRQGMGRALMQELISAAQRAGATEIRQEIRASNYAAQALGQNMGFVQDGRRRQYYSDPREDALLLRYLLRKA